MMFLKCAASKYDDRQVLHYTADSISCSPSPISLESNVQSLELRLGLLNLS